MSLSSIILRKIHQWETHTYILIKWDQAHSNKKMYHPSWFYEDLFIKKIGVFRELNWIIMHRTISFLFFPYTKLICMRDKILTCFHALQSYTTHYEFTCIHSYFVFTQSLLEHFRHAQPTYSISIILTLYINFLLISSKFNFAKTRAVIRF